MLKKAIYKKKTVILVLIWFLELLINIWYTTRYVLVHLMNSDWSGDAIFARHLADTGHYILSPDWIPTTELYIVHHQLIMVPLFKIFDDYKIVWTITSVIAYLLVSLSIFYFMRCMKQGFDEILLAVVLFLNPLVVENLTYTVWFHGYLFYYLMAFVLVGVLGKYYVENKKIQYYDLGIVIVISFLSGVCGIRMFIMVFVPLIISWLLLNRNNKLVALWNGFAKNSCIALMVSALAFAVYYFVLSPRYGAGFVVNAVKSNALTINSAEIMVNNFLRLPQLFLIVLGCDFQNNSIGVLVLLKAITLCFWSVIFGVIIKEIKKNWEDVRIKYIATFLGASLFTTILLIVFLVKPEEIVDDARYLSLSGFLMFPLYSMLSKEKRRVKLIDFLDVLGYVVATIGIVAFAMNVIVSYGIGEQTSWRMPYISYLEENDYEFGLATYWNANDTMFFSENRIEMQPIENELNLVYVASNTKKSNADKIPQFILFTQEEYSNRMNENCMDEILYKDDRVVIIKANMQDEKGM